MMDGLPTLIEFAIRSTAACLITVLLLLCLRKSAAAYRHLVCVLGLFVLLTLPLLRGILPPIPLPDILSTRAAPHPPVIHIPVADSIAPVTIPISPIEVVPSTIVPSPAPVRTLSITPGSLFLVAWLTGSFLLLARLGISLFRLNGWKTRTAAATPDQAAWLTALAREQRITTPVTFRIGPADTAPATWGVVRPIILLPESLASENPAGESAARHELAHIARRDWLWQIFAEVVCVVYWFQPGVWWLRHRLRVESELACDDAVLLSGVSATDYAAHLLTVARQCRRTGLPDMHFLAMARPHGLEPRVQAILNERLQRYSSPSRRVIIALFAIPVLGASALQGVASPDNPDPVPPPVPPARITPPSSPAPVSPASPAMVSPEPVPRAAPRPGQLPPSWEDSLQNFLTSSFLSLEKPSGSTGVAPNRLAGKPASAGNDAYAALQSRERARNDAASIAWGKERNGLQVGIRLPRGVTTFSSLKHARFEVVIRNASSQAIVFGWWGYPTIEQFSPRLFTAAGKKVEFMSLLAGPYRKHSERLEPGQQKTLGTLHMPVTVLAGNPSWDEYAPYKGQFRARFELSLDLGDGNGSLPGRDELQTGDQTFTVIPESERPAASASNPGGLVSPQAVQLSPTEETPFPLRSNRVSWNKQDLHLVTLNKPAFQITPKTKRLLATCDGNTVSFDEVTYTATINVYNATGDLLGSARTPIPVQRLWVGRVLTSPIHLTFDFGPSTAFVGATRYAMTLSNERVLTPDEWQTNTYDKAKEHLDKIREARKQNDNKALWELFSDRRFDEAVNAAATEGDEAIVAELVQQSWFGGPQSGGNGVTWAAYYPTEKPVAALLRQGVPADVANASGDTGLHLTYRVEIARLLLDQYAKLEVRNRFGQTPLIAQASRGNPWTGRGILRLLLERGANVDATDNDGMTALMYAAKAGMADDVKLLLQRGANRKRKDNRGKTARDYAAPWPWQRVPGFLTEERSKELEAEAKWDQERIRQLLDGREDPGDYGERQAESRIFAAKHEN